MNENTKIRSFTDLKTWREGHQLVILVYEVTKKFPRDAFSLIDQMRRSSSSVTSNIAEGFGRNSYREKLQFYYLAQGSLTELKNQILIAKDVKYLSDSDVKELVIRANNTHQLLQGLMTKTKSFLIRKS